VGSSVPKDGGNKKQTFNLRIEKGGRKERNINEKKGRILLKPVEAQRGATRKVMSLGLGDKNWGRNGKWLPRGITVCRIDISFEGAVRPG